MDLAMPGMGGVAAIKVLSTRCPDARIIALTSFADPRLVQDAVNAGAIGYLLKNVSTPTLAEAVLAAADGRPIMGPEAVQALVQMAADPHPIGSDLTPREREILAMLAKGLTNHEIAQRMSVSEATVRFHVGNVLSKLEVGNRTEAVQVAFKYAWWSCKPSEGRRRAGRKLHHRRVLVAHRLEELGDREFAGHAWVLILPSASR